MRKTAIVLAGMAAFDLGVMVVPAYAADKIDDYYLKHNATTAQPAPASGGGLKVVFSDILISSLKLDGASPEKACGDRKGTLVMKEGQQYCRVPVTGSK